MAATQPVSEAAWLHALSLSPAAEHVVRLPGHTAPAAPILSGSGPGPYAGELRLDGAHLHLDPLADLEHWVRAAVDLRDSIPVSGGESAALLLGLIWSYTVDGASRHGPPAFRRSVTQTGSTVRGHLDVRATVRMRAKGASTVASVFRTRDLDNPVTRAIVAADRVLVRQIGHTRWRTDRVDDILPQLHVAVGRRATLPGAAELSRMRYTPITRPFKAAAELSARIVRQDPVSVTPRPGRVQGLVIDVDDVRRHAAMEWIRSARPGLALSVTQDGAIVAGGIELRLADLPATVDDARTFVLRLLKPPAKESGIVPR